MTTDFEPTARIQQKLFTGNFAGWKLDVIFALATDQRLQPSDVRVALILLHHLNSRTLQMFPSQELIAQLSGMGRRNAISCLERLRENGWLKWDRGNRQHANDYAFDEQTVADQIARAKQLVASRKERKKVARKLQSDVNHSAHRRSSSTRTTVHVGTRTAVHTNTSIEHSPPKSTGGKTDAA